MTPKDFIHIWSSTGDKVRPISPASLSGLGLKPSTKEFLILSGLPDSAAPMLSFVDNSTDTYNSIGRLRDRFDLSGNEFEKYIYIGSCSDGDPIVVNTAVDDQIEWLNHDKDFEPGFFNSSIEAFVECLVICRDFITRVNRENGDFAFIDGNFSDEQLEDFRRNLVKADKHALCDNSFWKEELEMYLAMRDQFRKSE
ncbi:SUKH-4 family immunity protein [Chryseolinea sp. H1M3-3]|uniref:SUKH-4 family immunity protein n=1 Tax=Chryseolinea sp. H1M3-3 TaxID=3034144 RepID=UPI0023EC5F6F|nr:SUKH-4 family immunity protein [Chryseolinea sp. H1M3-3]